MNNSFKICNNCKIEKPLDNYSLAKAGGGKRRATCKKCCSLKRKRRSPVEGVSIECRVCHTSKPCDEFGQNYSTVTGRSSICKSCDALKTKAYIRNNPEIKKMSDYNYRQKNTEAIKARTKNYHTNKPWVKISLNSKRRVRERNALPPWANLDKIKAIYKECHLLCLQTGIPHHVDHIIPISGKRVCGLHVENNLQILTASENLKKHNSF